MSLSRRRFITIAACASVIPGAAAASQGVIQRWTGQAMGAHASLVVNGLPKTAFDRLSAKVTAETERLEAIFSLYRPDSDLGRLNRDGRLDNPAPELVELLSLSGSIHRRCDGAFDPTIQPLWDLYARSAGKPDPQAVDHLCNQTGWNNVQFDSRQISFAKPGMAMTLNGIAQGLVTDRIANLLRRQGLKDVLVSMGEIAALGKRSPDQAWRVGVSETADGTPEETLSLANQAIATSAPSGTLFDAAGAIGHILDPRSGKPTVKWRRISVIHASATVADGLSTACCVLSETGIKKTLAQFPGSRIIALDHHGRRLDLLS